MKEGWKYKKLGEVCCKSSNIKWDDVSNDASYKYIDLTSVYRTDLSIHDPQIITKENAPSRAKQIVKVGDVIFATTRPTLRRVSLIDDKHDGALCSTGFCVLRPNTEISSKWIFYCLQNNGFYNYIEPLQTGASYPAVTDGIVKGYMIPVPPLDEQKRIVERLDAAFENIDKLKANAEKQLAEAQTLFQKSLAKAMEPKEGWEERLLSEIVHPNCSLSYGIVQPGDHVENGIPVVRPVDFNNQLYVKMDGLKRTKPEISDSYQRTILKGGEILLCVRGTTGTMGIASDELIGCNVTRGIVPIYFDVDVCTKFVYYELLSPSLQDEIAHKTTGAALKQINIKDLRNLHMSIPPLAEQQRIVERLDALSENIHKYEEIQRQIISECDALKQALLRKVFE